MKANYYSLTRALFITTVVMIGLLTTQLLTAQGWYDTDWEYRREVTVDNPGGTALTDYQVLVTLDGSFDFSNAKADGSDIRLTASDGITLIPFWIEEWNYGTQATIWVKVPSIPTSGTTVYLYYGNAVAASVSNGGNTFEFFDDFESWNPTLAAWSDKQLLPTPKSDHTCAVYNGKLYAIGGYNNTAGDARNENYEYDPATNTWAIKTPMPTARWGPVAVEFNGNIYVFGGQLSNGAGTDKNEVYDPVNDTWTSTALGNPLPIPDYGASGVVHPDVVYFPQGKDGYKYWMAYTPYPPQSKENPSVIRSNDGITWTGAGITNPVIPAGLPGSWNDLENPDPDFIYVSAIDKWFLVWNGGDQATNSRKLALAYSSDGKTWTQYDGTPVNGNTNPVILSGTDTQGQEWERDGSGYSKTSCPTLFYDNGTFYLYYVEEASGNNNGDAGFATFTWDNATNSVVDLQRYESNPTITKGCGHINLSWNPTDDLYYMHHVYGSNLELMTSSDLISWTDIGIVLEPGTVGEWDGSSIYRSCPVVDDEGSIVSFEGNTRIYYSANGSIPFGIGIADIPPTGPPVKYQGQGPANMPGDLAAQGLMGVKFGDKIHLFYKYAHYEYDPATDTYTTLANVPTPRTWSTVGVVGSKIYVIGGYSYGSPGGATNVNEIYDPATDSWSSGAVMPVSKYGITREDPVIDGKIYATHGLNGGFHVDNYMYDPAMDTWQQKQSAVHLRDGVGCGIINNKLYVVGGRADHVGPYGTSFNEVYDPTLDTWSPPQWTTSGPSFAFAHADAAYNGNYGLVVQQIASVGVYRYAETMQGFGDVYALDLSWNLTDAGGIHPELLQPQGVIYLSDFGTYERLFFYNDNGIPMVKWYYGGFTSLQSSTYNSWHKLTIVRNGVNSKVVFDGTQYPVSGTTGGAGKVNLGVYFATKEYFDDVRVRKYAESEPSTSVGGEQIIKTLNLSVFLEGPFNETVMNAILNAEGHLPLVQPYNTDPWNYTGTESLIDIPGTDVVDWILVELRDAPDPDFATTDTRVARQAALLLNDGAIVGLDGSSSLHFIESIDQQLFVVLWHRNHLGIMSANALTPSPEGVYSYDFTTAASQAYGDGQNFLGNDNYGMTGGDTNADGIINDSDAIQIWIPQAGTAGYLNGDVNLNGQVNNPDKNDMWYENLNKQTQVPD